MSIARVGPSLVCSFSEFQGIGGLTSWRRRRRKEEENRSKHESLTCRGLSCFFSLFVSFSFSLFPLLSLHRFSLAGPSSPLLAPRDGRRREQNRHKSLSLFLCLPLFFCSLLIVTHLLISRHGQSPDASIHARV